MSSLEYPNRSEQLLLTVAEAALCLSISPSAFRRLIKGGQIAAVNIGRSVRIPRTELGRFIADQLAVDEFK